MVTIRNLRCRCGKEVTTKTSIGHHDYVEYAFPCPNCGVEIRYGMEADQDEPEFDFKRLKNASWTESKTVFPNPIINDAETLVSLEPVPVSPFIFSSHLPKDFLQFNKHREIRISAVRKGWPALQNVRAYFDRDDWANFFTELKKVYPASKSENEIQARYELSEVLRQFGGAFAPFQDDLRVLTIDRLENLDREHPELSLRLREYFEAIGWIEDLEKEYLSIKDAWPEIFWILQPLYLTLYWDDTRNSLSEFKLSQKRFKELKPFFSDLYETLARTSVIAAGVEGILAHGSLKVRTASRMMPLDEFRKKDNGSKWDLLKSLPVAGAFSMLEKNRMRNGIGHHSAHYDAGRDVIEYKNDSRTSGTVRTEISYNDFCQTLLQLYIQFEVASIYIQWLCAFDIETVRSVVRGSEAGNEARSGPTKPICFWVSDSICPIPSGKLSE